MYLKSLANISCVSSSPQDPFAIVKKRAKSIGESLKSPSAIFDVIETAALRI